MAHYWELQATRDPKYPQQVKYVYQPCMITITDYQPCKAASQFGCYQPVQILAADGMRSVGASIFWSKKGTPIFDLAGYKNREVQCQIKLEPDSSQYAVDGNKLTIMMNPPAGSAQQPQQHAPQQQAPAYTAPRPQTPPQQYSQPQTPQGQPDWDAIARGKVKHGVVCAAIQGNQIPCKTLVDVGNLVNYIMDPNQ